MAQDKDTQASPIQLTVATSEQREVQMESKLFYILPPLLVAAVFLYCALSDPPESAAPAAPAVEAVPEEIDMDEFSDEELNVEDDEEEPSNPEE